MSEQEPIEVNIADGTPSQVRPTPTTTLSLGSIRALFHDPRLGRNAQSGPVELAVFAVLFGGGILLMISTFGLQRRLSEHSVPTFATQLRIALPTTIAEAGTSLGLNGGVVAAVLYAVLIAGMIGFFGGAFLR